MAETPPKSLHEKRPWGDEFWITGNSPSMIKIISVLPGESLSLQFHNLRDEYWYIISGNGSAEIGLEKINLESGKECFIQRGMKHRLHGGNQPLILLELSFGEFNQEDIVRLEDKYGRV